MRAILERVASFIRRAGGFAAAEDAIAIKQQVKAAGERLKRLDTIETRLDAIKRQNHELRGEVRRLRRLMESESIRGLGNRVGRSHGAVEKGFRAVRRNSKAERKRLDRIESQVSAVLRALYFQAEELEYPYRTTVQRFGLLSQNGEDGITAALLRAVAPQDRRFVEIGCSDHGWNTGFLAEELGWSGLMVDRDAVAVAATRLRFPTSTVRTAVATVTPNIIDELFRAHGFDVELDVLSIDVDGNDYWLWKGLNACQPRLVIIEYNPVFGAKRAVVVPYNEGDDWTVHAREHRYFGASLRAFQRLAFEKGYRLVAVEPDSANAFFLRHDLARDVPAVDPGQLFRIQRKHRKVALRQTEDIYAICAANRLPLIEVSAPAGLIE
jgi:hypothetical protein